MSRLLKSCCLLLCAAPAFALADSYMITTHSTGTARPSANLLTTLGMDTAYGLQDLPYELTLSSVHDLPFGGSTSSYEGYFDYSSAIVADFRLGDMHYHSDGTGVSYVWRGPSSGLDTYDHEVEYRLADSPWTYKFKQSGILVLPTLNGEGALEVRDLGPTDVVYGNIEIGAYTPDPDVPIGGGYLLDSSMSTLSVRVVSAVPEPATYVLLAVGILTLGLRRRYGRAVAPAA